jgi:hypothetical protein
VADEYVSDLPEVPALADAQSAVVYDPAVIDPLDANGQGTLYSTTLAALKAYCAAGSQPLDADLTALAGFAGGAPYKNTIGDWLSVGPVTAVGVDAPGFGMNLSANPVTGAKVYTVQLADAAAFLAGTGAAPLASPTFTGTPAAPTAAPGTDTTQVATTAFVAAAVAAAPGGEPGGSSGELQFNDGGAFGGAPAPA